MIGVGGDLAYPTPRPRPDEDQHTLRIYYPDRAASDNGRSHVAEK